MLILGVARLDSNKEKRQLRIGAVHTREAQKKRENIYKKKRMLGRGQSQGLLPTTGS